MLRLSPCLAQAPSRNDGCAKGQALLPEKEMFVPRSGIMRLFAFLCLLALVAAGGTEYPVQALEDLRR